MKKIKLYERKYYEGFLDDWDKFLKSIKDVKDTMKHGGSYKQLKAEQTKLKSHLSDVKGEIKDIKEKIAELNSSSKNKKAIKQIQASIADLTKEKSELPTIKEIEAKYKGKADKIFDTEEEVRKKRSDLQKDINKYEDALEEFENEKSPDAEKEEKKLETLKKSQEEIQKLIKNLRDKLIDMSPTED